jgi:hypothetical protein
MKKILKIVSVTFIIFTLVSSTFYLRYDASFYFVNSQIKEDMSFKRCKEIWSSNPDLHVEEHPSMSEKSTGAYDEYVVVLSPQESKMIRGYITLIFVKDKLQRKHFMDFRRR